MSCKSWLRGSVVHLQLPQYQIEFSVTLDVCFQNSSGLKAEKFIGFLTAIGTTISQKSFVLSMLILHEMNQTPICEFHNIYWKWL
jgi:hypothetical protein